MNDTLKELIRRSKTVGNLDQQKFALSVYDMCTEHVVNTPTGDKRLDDYRREIAQNERDCIARYYEMCNYVLSRCEEKQDV